MESFNHKFQSSEKIPYNDDVYAHLFELANYNYTISIRPHCRFWRFGIRLSKTENIEFYHPIHRYKDPEFWGKYIDIHLGVGEHENSVWSLPNKLRLVQYNLKGPEHDFVPPQETYIEQGEIEWKIEYNKKENIVTTSYTAAGCQPALSKLHIPENFKYFKVFAWADNTDFEIDCKIEIEELFFSIDQITFRLGDMMDEDVLNQTDVLIFPASTDGVASDSILSIVHQLDIGEPPKNAPGSILLFDRRFNQKFLQVGWAYSVDISESNLDIILSICNKIIDTFPSGISKTINIPLFGTGSGNLNPVDVVSIYTGIFNSGNNNPKFFISIIEYEIFKKIKDYFKNIQDKGLDVKSKLHSDSYNLDEADVLQYDLIAENLFTILTDEATNPPLNIGILAPWGRGKTSLMKRIKKKFDDIRIKEYPKPLTRPSVKFSISHFRKWAKSKFEKIPNIPSIRTIINWLKTDRLELSFDIRYSTVWFNPWNYQSSEMIWGGLAYSVIEQTVSQIPDKAQRELFRLQLRLARFSKEKLRKDIQNYSIAVIIQILIFGTLTLSCLILALLLGKTWLSLITCLPLIPSIFFLRKYFQTDNKTIIKKLEKYDKPVEYLNKLGTFHEVESDLKKVFDYLIKTDKPLVVFVDDLDRCSPAKVVEVIEAINVFINSDAYKDKCYFILGMDAEMVAAALDVTYDKMKGKMGVRELEQGSVGWYFLDKFIQLPFFIPVMSETKKKEYLSSLFKEKTASDISTLRASNINKVEQVFDKVMTAQPKENLANVISTLTTEEQKELDKKILQNQVELNKQNEEIDKQVSKYAQFISADPRTLKRFANLLRFYASYQFLKMKKNQPFVEINILAKWIAIMLKFPQLIRWIQWDSENKSGVYTSAEDKADMLDKLISQFSSDNKTANNFDNWLAYELPKSLQQFTKNDKPIKIEDSTEMSWLKSRNFFNLLMYERSNKSTFRNALNCNVW